MLTSSHLAFMEEAGTGRDYDLMDCQTFSKSNIIWGCVCGKSIGMFAKKKSFSPLPSTSDPEKKKCVSSVKHAFYIQVDAP